ncbi:MAG: sulfotransferase domain-containing protein [Gallionellaceae bacterium]
MNSSKPAKANNLIDFAKVPAAFRNPDYHYEVSSRFISPDVDPLVYIKFYYMYLDIAQVDSVFGNAVYPSRLYGGRVYDLEHSLTDKQIKMLGEQGKGVTFTLTGQFFSEEVYQANRHFLQKYHKKGNGIVCTNDELARRIRADFPDYGLKASVIKNLNTVDKVRRALKLYDRVVLPMDKNDDDEFLQALPEKSRIVLFANANCGYNCEARTCYTAISQMHWDKQKTIDCSKSWLPRADLGYSFFDVDKFAAMGFHHFKLVPNARMETSDFFINKFTPKSTSAPLPERAQLLYSYSKCGRTWLRFMLANYFNLAFKLEIPVNLQSLFTLLPNDFPGLKGVEHFQFDHIPDLPLIVSSHELSEKRPGILLLRSIPDVVVSDYFQQQKPGVTTGPLSEFYSASVRRYCQYLNSWAEDESYTRQHVLTYESLHLDAVGELEKLLGFLAVPVQRDHIENAVLLSAFKSMQESEKTIGHAGRPQAKDNLKVRKGEVGGYVNYLSPDEISNLFKIADEVLLPQSKVMLKKYGIAQNLERH